MQGAHLAGMSLKMSLPLHESMVEQEEMVPGGHRYHRHVHGITEVNSLHDAIRCLRSPALSVPADSTMRFLRNYFQLSKLGSRAATAATLIAGAGTHADGSFLWGVTTSSLTPSLQVNVQLDLTKNCSKGY